MIRTAVGATLCVTGLVSMVPGVLLITVGKRLAEGPPRFQEELWRSYLTHPSAVEYARRVVRAGGR